MRSKIISRPSLLQHLDQGLKEQRPLSLICAPAGYGKTTLAADWLANVTGDNLASDQSSLSKTSSALKIAWLSLEEQDDAPVRFLSYLAAAVQSVDASACKSLLPVIKNPQLPSPENLAALFVNEMQQIQEYFILVLDDIHVLQSENIRNFLCLVIEHLPPLLHMVLISREEPFLPLARLRSRNLITELNSDDLCFNDEEACRFLKECMHLDIKPEYALDLSHLTEGWAAGLQLAGLSLQGKNNVPAVLENMSSRQHFVMDYMINEVLGQIPDELRRFLMGSSIFDRFCAPLCDAVLDRDDSRQMLQQLEQKNLFLIPIDTDHVWYRYHHLFTDMLRRQQRQEMKQDEIERMHHHASTWFDQNGFTGEAIEHACIVSDWQTMEKIIKKHTNECFQSGDINLLLEWMQDIPDSILAADAVLCSDYGWALALTNQPDRADICFQKAAPCFQDDANSLGQIMVGQAYVAFCTNSLQRCLELGKEALHLLAEENLWMRSVCRLTLGLAYWDLLDVQQCETAMQAVIECGGYAAGRNRSTALAYLGAIHMIRMDFTKARQYLNQAIQPSPTGEYYAGSDLAFTYLSSLYYELNQHEEALQWLEKGVALCRLTGNTVLQINQYCQMARIYMATARLPEAESMIDKAGQLGKQQAYRSSWFSLINAIRVELDIAKGDVVSAEKTVIHIDEDIYMPLMAYPGLARAHFLLCRGKEQQANTLLDNLYQKAQDGGWHAACFRINLLRALTDVGTERSRQLLISCLEDACPSGFIQPFIDAGDRMRQALIEANLQLHAPQFAVFVDEIIEMIRPDDTNRTQKQTSECTITQTGAAVIEPLTERELEVLQMLVAEPGYDEIARKMVLSTNTIKAHIKHIYAKLGVSNRRQALARGKELNLLSTFESG